MTKYYAIFGVCALLAYILLALVELSFDIALGLETQGTLGIIITATAFILVGMHNGK